MRLVFMGSPAEVISPLQHLIKISELGEHTLLGVVSQPSRPFGRKQLLTDPPVASYAKQIGLMVWQPEKASDPGFLESLHELNPDVIITAAYGQILTEKFLQIPKRATINIHPSMLPLYRGATPVPAALLDNQKETAVTILFTVKALDAGSIIVQQKFSIGEQETSGVLTDRLFRASGPLLDQALQKLSDPLFTGTSQNPEQVTFCKKINKNDGSIEWMKSTDRLINEYRAYNPWPGSFTQLGITRIVVEECHPATNLIGELKPGEFKFDRQEKALRVGTGSGQILISRLKPAGSKSLEAIAFWNGSKILEKGTFS